MIHHVSRYKLFAVPDNRLSFGTKRQGRDMQHQESKSSP